MDRRAFYDAIRTPIFGGALSGQQVQGLENLLNVWDKYFSDGSREELAYNLGTAFHEVGATMQPITERGPRAYFDKYEPGTPIGKRLGNIVPGDGYRFRGEGHVQNTGRANAAKATRRINEVFGLNVDLVNRPEQRGDPFVSAISLFLGNREGWWTGKNIADYIDGIDESDADDWLEYARARRIVNGTDKAEKIANHALAFEKALKAAGYGVREPQKPIVTQPSAPAPKPPPAPAKPWWKFW